MTFTTNNIKMVADLLDKVVDAPDYEGRQFEVDNILVWLKLEIRMLKMELQLVKKEKHD